ncbi:MAG: lysophospholipid acyltransferase family protein [Thermoleophilia bacterium]|nr:lysophospholipid acyltransferase family protein [Thermoleophilia bacterium]
MSLLLYGFLRILITNPLKFFFRMEIRGTEYLPKRGPAILASNHLSNMDPPLLCLSYSGQICWMAKAELLRVPLLGKILTKLGAFPVRRGENDRDAIRRARELLEMGYVIGMFPEGTRQSEGAFGEPQPGVGLLAMTPGVPVIPIRIRGTGDIISGGWFHRAKVTVTAGPPVDMEIEGMSKGKAYREASRRIMAAIGEL